MNRIKGIIYFVLFLILPVCFNISVKADSFTLCDGFYYEDVSEEFKSKMQENFEFPKNEYIRYKDLRVANLKYIGFNGEVNDGKLIVNEKVAKEVLEIFKEVFDKKYPIKNMSSFCFRKIANSERLSWHALGLAIDINYNINPHVLSNGKTIPENCGKYKDRTLDEKGLIKEGDDYYNAFIKRGWDWGGHWDDPDYMHFCKMPRRANIEKKYPICCTPGLKTIKNILKTSLEPVGTTLYVWGGGWFKNENGKNITYGSNRIGVHPEWKEFYESQNSNYKWDDWKFKTEKGLDCSGYVGWVIYNVMNTESGNEGYNCISREMAKKLSDRGYGKYIKYGDVKDYKPGDIMSGETPRHVWICIGECKDKSVVFLHSSYQGVHICGTSTPDGNENSEAYNLSKKYMQKYYKDFYDRYPVFKNTTENKEQKQFIRDIDYLTKYNQMRWYISDSSVIQDPDGYIDMSPEEILKDLFNEN